MHLQKVPLTYSDLLRYHHCLKRYRSRAVLDPSLWKIAPIEIGGRASFAIRLHEDVRETFILFHVYHDLKNCKNLKSNSPTSLVTSTCLTMLTQFNTRKKKCNPTHNEKMTNYRTSKRNDEKKKNHQKSLFHHVKSI